MSITSNSVALRKNIHRIDLQNACVCTLPVSNKILTSWASLTLNQYGKPAEITLRLTDAHEIAELNNTYRKKNKPTNVLAFPSHAPKDAKMKHTFLGDVIVCPEVLEQEALEQNTPLDAHWAHIIIHGVLHLLGYDHIEDEDANRMQAVEIELLNGLGFYNPYHEVNDIES